MEILCKSSYRQVKSPILINRCAGLPLKCHMTALNIGALKYWFPLFFWKQSSFCFQHQFFLTDRKREIKSHHCQYGPFSKSILVQTNQSLLYVLIFHTGDYFSKTQLNPNSLHKTLALLHVTHFGVFCAGLNCATLFSFQLKKMLVLGKKKSSDPTL